MSSLYTIFERINNLKYQNNTIANIRTSRYKKLDQNIKVTKNCLNRILNYIIDYYIVSKYVYKTWKINTLEM